MKRLLVMLVIAVLSLPMVSYGNLSGFGTATIDGVMSPGEWDNAAKVDFQANVPEGGTTSGTFYVMNNGNNLYLALKVARSSFGLWTYFLTDFDNNNNGIQELGDDGLQLYVGDTIPLTFLDTYYSSSGTSEDKTAGGAADGAWAAHNDGSFTIMELSHPLCTTDTLHDFCLKLGDTVGLRAELKLYSISGTVGDTMIPVSGTALSALVAASGSSYGQLTIASPMAARVIDIKPGSRENPINTKSEGKIPVAILSTSDWSAPAKVDRDRASLTFGHDGTEQSLAFCNEDAQDVNNDGIPDLVCHFSTQLTGFKLGDTFGILNGKTKGGAGFTAKDSVRIVK